MRAKRLAYLQTGRYYDVRHEFASNCGLHSSGNLTSATGVGERTARLLFMLA